MWNYKIRKFDNSENDGRMCECGSFKFGVYRTEMFCLKCGLVVGGEEKNNWR